MSTKKTEKDWVAALQVFRASLPRRGDKGRDDRLSGAILFEARQIAHGTVLYLSLAGSLLLVLLAFAGWS